MSRTLHRIRRQIEAGDILHCSLSCSQHCHQLLPRYRCSSLSLQLAGETFDQVKVPSVEEYHQHP